MSIAIIPLEIIVVDICLQNFTEGGEKNFEKQRYANSTNANAKFSYTNVAH